MNYSKSFLDYLEKGGYLIYFHLFSLLDEDKLDLILSRFKDSIKNGDKDWFYDFHKSIRQTDFYNDGHLDMVLWNYIFERPLEGIIINFFEDLIFFLKK